VWQREAFEHYAGRPLASEAAERAHEIIASHEVLPLPDDVMRHIDDVIDAYARSVGAPADRVPWKDQAAQ
jgi:hypothetical protein